MEQITSIVLPVFGIIGVGYLVAWSGLISIETGDAIADFVYSVPIPVLVFRTMSQAEFEFGSLPILIAIAHLISFSVMWTAGTLVIRRVFGRDARAGVVGGTAASYGNALMLGIPLTMTAYGDAALPPATLLVSVQFPILMIMSTILIERALIVDGVANAAMRPRELAASVARNVAMNPILIGLVLGFAWRFGGLALPGPVESMVDRLSGIAGTLALLALGMGLRKFGISGNATAALALAFLKLLVMPTVALLVVLFLVPLPPLWAKVAVVVAACPCGSNVYIVASHFRIGEALASNTIVLTILLSIVNVALWLAVVEGVL